MTDMTDNNNTVVITNARQFCGNKVEELLEDYYRKKKPKKDVLTRQIKKLR